MTTVLEVVGVAAAIVGAGVVVMFLLGPWREE